MPAGDGGRLNQYEGLFPPVPQPVASTARTNGRQGETSVRTREDAELVTQCHGLKNEISPSVQGRANLLRDGQKEPNHRVSVWRQRCERQRFFMDGIMANDIQNWSPATPAQSWRRRRRDVSSGSSSPISIGSTSCAWRRHSHGRSRDTSLRQFELAERVRGSGPDWVEYF